MNPRDKQHFFFSFIQLQSPLVILFNRISSRNSLIQNYLLLFLLLPACLLSEPRPVFLWLCSYRLFVQQKVVGLSWLLMSKSEIWVFPSNLQNLLWIDNQKSLIQGHPNWHWEQCYEDTVSCISSLLREQPTPTRTGYSLALAFCCASGIQKFQNRQQYDLAIERSEGLIYGTTWINLKNLMLSKRSQTQKALCYLTILNEIPKIWKSIEL